MNSDKWTVGATSLRKTVSLTISWQTFNNRNCMWFK